MNQSKLRSLARSAIAQKRFVPGETYIPVSGKVFDEEELMLGVEAVLDGWWTEGRFVEQFEKEFSRVVGCRYVSLVNSGSSANLIALTALTSSVFGEKRLKPGDEVITVACGFPTTVNPIIQNRCVPVFVDVDLATKNIDVTQIQRAITKKTKAIMIAHSLGNPFDIGQVMEIVAKNKLWLIEDSCDALGATYRGQAIGSFGHVATFSFYPAHQITMGEGGAVVTNNPLIHKAIRQFRDWGRDCWCDTGKDNTCRRRFDWQLGKLPHGYDHKYIYSQIGYNLKLTEMQAAIGVAQLKKLSTFVSIRRKNYAFLKQSLSKYSHWLHFSESLLEMEPSWFGFMIVIDQQAPFTKREFVTFLEDHKVGTRSLFAGNILKHPAYVDRKDVRVVGTLEHTGVIMERGFWIGVYPGITLEMLQYIVTVFDQYFTHL